MTLDTSAILASLLDEAERVAFVSQIEQADRRLVLAVTVLEASMVLEGQKATTLVTTWTSSSKGRPSRWCPSTTNS